MYVIMDVRVPSKLTREQKKVIESLKDTDLSDSKLSKFNKFVKDSE